MMDSGQYVSQVQWKQNPATLRTQEMPDCYSQCVALTMAWNAAWFTLLTTRRHTEDSNLLRCGAVSLGVHL